MTDKELIKTLVSALQTVADQMDQVSGLIDDEDAAFHEAHNEVREALTSYKEYQEGQ